MTISDEAIRLATQGDRGSQQLIYESLWPQVRRLIERIVGRDAADDVTQDLFIHVFEKLSSYNSASRFTTWVYRVAVNDALQHLRRQRRRTTVALPDSAIGATPADNLENRELVDVALGRLDADLRIILQLKEVDKLSYDQIAEIVSIPIGTVGSRLNKARRELREHLLRLGWEG